MKMQKQGLVILGAYGQDNAGDDASLRSIVEAMREFDRGLPVCVIGKKPRSLAAHFGVSALGRLSLLRIVRALRRSRLFVLGGGSLLQDVTSSRSLWYYLFLIRLAKRCGCAVQLYGGGLGPVTGEKNIRRCARVLDECVDVLCLRDRDSEALLASWGVTEPRILQSADPALRLKVTATPREKCIGFVLREWKGFWYHVPDFARAARYAFENYGLEPVFFVFGPGDATAARSVMAALEGIPCRLSNEPRGVGRMAVTISMRLHGLVFSLMSGVAAGGVSYDGKVAAFCREAGFGCVALPDVTAQGLCALIDRAMTADAEELSERRERLIRAESVNAETAWELLRE